ncbi:hypothetical protein [Brevundimonas sp.]|jgi:hypothetical protein|uniref:hypothetical protein n=1 Tax=Brevundimonas sp. TaxID=1871086 RepID=UPI0037C13E8B
MLLAAFAAALLQTAPIPEACAYDRGAMIALSPEAFDQDLNGGWRPIAAKPECQEAAADLLAAYREAHWGDLSVGELHTNCWHEGQVRASLGQTRHAIRLMMAGVNPQFQTDGFHEYALGTIAFLNRISPPWKPHAPDWPLRRHRPTLNNPPAPSEKSTGWS